MFQNYNVSLFIGSMLIHVKSGWLQLNDLTFIDKAKSMRGREYKAAGNQEPSSNNLFSHEVAGD